MPSYGGPNSGAAGAGAGSQGAAASGAAWGGMHGAGGNSAAAAGGQGPGKWGLLAQHQGSYGPMYSMGGYGGGYGHAGGYGGHHHHHHPHHMGTPAKQLLSAQFMPEGLRQQLQQSNYLTQLQVRRGGDTAAGMAQRGRTPYAVSHLLDVPCDLLLVFGKGASHQRATADGGGQGYTDKVQSAQQMSPASCAAQAVAGHTSPSNLSHPNRNHKHQATPSLSFKPWSASLPCSTRPLLRSRPCPTRSGTATPCTLWRTWLLPSLRGCLLPGGCAPPASRASAAGTGTPTACGWSAASRWEG